MIEKKYISELHSEHKDWLQQLNFYADELKIMKNELSEVSSKNTDNEVKVKVEQFQNRFLIQENELDILKQTVKDEEQLLKENILENPVTSDHRKISENTPLKERIEVFAPIFEEMRGEFKGFLAEVM